MTEFIAFGLINGILYGMLIFMLASGLTLIFSMMGVLNFAHASLFMMGAYLGYQISTVANFWVALIVAPVLVGIIGALIERYGLRKVHKYGHVAELLLTFGVSFVFEEIVAAIWGRLPVRAELPEILQSTAFTMFGIDYSMYRLFIVLISVAMFVALYLVIVRTRIGHIIKAALTHPDTLNAMGHNVPLVFMMVFAGGSFLAGLAGVIGGGYFTTEPSMAVQLGTIVFVVVVVGGLGSLGGALFASILIGVLQSFAVGIETSFGALFAFSEATGAMSHIAAIRISQLGPLVPFLLMVIVLAIRPKGLFGTREF